MRFASVLSGQNDLYMQAFGRHFQLRTCQTRSSYIGQIHLDTEVTDWTAWAQNEHGGVAWSGICEQFLGVELDQQEMRKLQTTVACQPEQMRDWDGRFGVCTWNNDQDSVYLATGATETRTFWYAEGPDGWAIGNHALPLLKLVGRQPVVNPDTARLYLAYGYMVSDESMFQGVTRIPTRRQVVSLRGERPSIRTYLALDAYFGDEQPAPDWKSTVANGAARLVTRVKRQLKHSPHPALLLTGGRDSRCIAAAAVRAGFMGSASTSGASNSDDVRIASEVARTLNIPHQLTTAEDSQRSLAALVAAPERVQLWMQLNEGTETIRHATAYQDFFAGRLPFPATIDQKFHGLGGEISRGYYYPADQDLSALADANQACAAFVDHAHSTLASSAPLYELVLDMFKRLESETNGMRLTLAQWLDLFYWQNRCLHWGADMISLKDLLGWRWNPLLDRELICAGWNLRPEQKLSNQFSEAVINTIQPSLKSVAYDKQGHGGRVDLMKVAKKRAKQIVRATPFIKRLLASDRSKKYTIDQHLDQFWQTLFLAQQPAIWPELIDDSKLKGLLKKPSDEMLWNLATVELVARMSVPEVAY